jgi:hypothetical protein
MEQSAMEWEHGKRDTASDAPASGSAGGAGLPATLDPIVTMGIVQRYVEQERSRNRRALLWVGLVFVLVVALLIAIVASAGLAVLRSGRHTSEALNKVRSETAIYASEVLGLSNSVGRLKADSLEIRSATRGIEANRVRERNALEQDLRRFSGWVQSRETNRERELSELRERLLSIEKQSTLHAAEVAVVRTQQLVLAETTLRVLSAAPSVSGGQQSVGAAGDEGTTSNGNDRTVAAVRRPLPGTVPAGASSAAPVSFADTEEARPRESDVGAGQRGEPKSIRIVTFKNGDRYEGELVGGLFHGWGTYSYRSGDRYEGEFAQDMKSGQGTYTYANGDRYVGEFRDDMKDGRGSLSFVDGSRYAGELSRDAITGQGTMHYANGNRYVGGFLDGRRHGRGTLTYSNGDAYTGEFSADARHGRGTYAFADGGQYVGEYSHDRREGKGRYTYPGGEEYVGEFRDGRRDGFGVCKYPNGQQVKGLWKADKFLRIVDG